MTAKKQNHLSLTGKVILSIACAATLTLSFTQIAFASESSPAASSADANSTENTASGLTDSTEAGASGSTVIGAEAAQNFAFADAGIDPLAAESVFTEYDYDDGQFLYEVDFTTEEAEYEYQIQAYDGSVLKKSVEYPGLKQSLSQKENASTALTLEEAKEVALADAELTEEELTLVTFTKEEADYDDGLSVYDIEFYTDTTKYEYEISAGTGDILELSVKYGITAQEVGDNTGSDSTENTGASNSAGKNSTDNSNTGSSNSGSTGSAASSEAGASDSYISLDEAKAIALEYAGLSSSDVTFKKAKLDKEHGTMVYELEFYQGRTEYECEINASTGAVIEFEIDH